MDAPTRLFLWSLTAAGYFGLLGALFGGLAAWVNHLDGRAGGSYVGRRVAESFEPLSPVRRALLVGAVDGLLFGTLLGTALAFAVVTPEEKAWPRLRPLFLAGLALVGVASLLGCLATRLARQQRSAVSGLSVGGLVGLTLGFVLGGADGLLIGAWAGLLLGAMIGLWRASRS